MLISLALDSRQTDLATRERCHLDAQRTTELDVAPREAVVGDTAAEQGGDVGGLAEARRLWDAAISPPHEDVPRSPTPGTALR